MPGCVEDVIWVFRFMSGDSAVKLSFAYVALSTCQYLIHSHEDNPSPIKGTHPWAHGIRDNRNTEISHSAHRYCESQIDGIPEERIRS